jgi:hypothetical protein
VRAVVSGRVGVWVAFTGILGLRFLHVGCGVPPPPYHKIFLLLNTMRALHDLEKKINMHWSQLYNHLKQEIETHMTHCNLLFYLTIKFVSQNIVKKQIEHRLT